MPARTSRERSATRAADRDPSSDAALMARDKTYARAPDMPVETAVRELRALCKLASGAARRLAQVGITAQHLDHLGRFTRRLGALEKSWLALRPRALASAPMKKLRTEAEALKLELIAGGEWACRNDPDALAQLSHVREGSSLADTIKDLRDLREFWDKHARALKDTDIAPADLARAEELADLLDGAADDELGDTEAAATYELRNRCFWAADELASEVRQGGKYAFRASPRVAAKYVSAYRAAKQRSHRHTSVTPGDAAAAPQRATKSRGKASGRRKTVSVVLDASVRNAGDGLRNAPGAVRNAPDAVRNGGEGRP